MKTPQWCAASFLFALAIVSLPAVYGQTVTATLTGTVTDQTGAVVPGVTVTAKNEGTQLEYATESSAAGAYTIPFLPVGNYVVSAELTGFKKAVTNPIRLEVNQTARVDLKMELGQLSDTISVTGVAPILQTEAPVVGNVISGRTTTNLPLNGRNFQQLTLLIPGTINPNPAGFNGVGQQTQGRPYVNGNREQGNAFLLDGVSVDETIDNRIGYKPNVDALEEFRVETSNSSAEFGNVTGATINATIKSGTNNFHGNLFEFIRNDALDAQTWANNRSGVTTKPKLRQHIYGGTLGGPIKKEKVFFFVDYQGTAQRTGGGGFIRVAPAAWRTGDLSTLVSTGNVQIRDPQTCTNPRDTSTCGFFAGGIIPANRIVNPVAKALFADTSLYPLPSRIDPTNATGILDVVTGNEVNGHQFDVKIDYKLSDKDNLSTRYSYADFDAGTVQGQIAIIPGSRQVSTPQNAVVNWVRTLSPKTINEARVGFNRAVFVTDNVYDWAGVGDLNARFGIPGGQAHSGLALVTPGSGLTNVGGSGSNENNYTNTFHYGDNLTFLRGRHTFKLGGQWQRYQQNRFYAGNNGILGSFNYSTTYTGVQFGDFLLDQLQRKALGGAAGTNKGLWGHRQNRIGLFFQDDFKMRPNFTWILGMRWEYTSPVVEVVDRQANFELFSGRELFAGRDGNSRALYEPFYKGFEPRIGFAWTLADRFVIRAGYGITQYMEGTGSNLRLPLNPPFFAEADVTYDLTTGPGTVATGFNDVIARDTAFRPDPCLGPERAPPVHAAVQPVARARVHEYDVADGGLRGTHRHAPGRPHRLEPAPSGHRRRDHLARVPAPPPALLGPARRDADQRHGLLGRQPLPQPAGERAPAIRRRAGIPPVVYLQQDHDRQPRLLRLGGRCRLRAPTRPITTTAGGTTTVRRSSTRPTTSSGREPTICRSARGASSETARPRL